MERPEEAPLIDRDLCHKHARTHTHRGRDNSRDQHVNLLHVSVNTGGGESVEVTCCTQLESTTAYVTIILSTVVAIQPFANTPIHRERVKALQRCNRHY